jgi:hypothetical protein
MMRLKKADQGRLIFSGPHNPFYLVCGIDVDNEIAEIMRKQELHPARRCLAQIGAGLQQVPPHTRGAKQQQTSF